MFEDYCTSFKNLFLCAKYEECSSVQENFLERHGDRSSKSKSNLYDRFYFDNNLIVSKTLALHWTSELEQSTSKDWVAAFLHLSDLHGSVQCLHNVCNIPLDLSLCITYNILCSAIMKVEPFNEYSNSTHHALVMATHTLQKVLNINGDTQLRGSSDNSIEDILFLAVCISKHILHHPPRECLLLIDVVLLALLLILEREQTETINNECLRVVDLLISMAPQTRIHLMEEKTVFAEENFMRNFPLLRFGMNTAGDVLDEDQNCILRFGTSFQTLLIIGTICCFRVKQFSLSLKYLQDKDILPLQYSFLIYYVKALVQLKLGDGDRCVYFLSRCSPTIMDDIMQARHHILQSQAHMHLGNHACALQTLQKVLRNRGNIRLPITAFLMAQCYGALGQTSRQIESLDTLAECLNADVPVTPLLSKPTNGFEHRLLLFFHPPTEISLPEVLYASAVACLHSQPKKASDQLLNLLHMIENDPDSSEGLELPALTDLLHSTIIALLKADCGEDAKIVCNAALEQHKMRSDTQENTPLKFLQDDVIALMLLAESQQCCHNLLEAQSTLNKATKILKENCKEPSSRGRDSSKLFSDLLARVYLFKALINVERSFKDDAAAFFQRALTYNPDDREVLLHFAHHLYDTDQQEECLAIWSLLQDKKYEQNEETTVSKSIALQYLLGDRTSSHKKDLITNRMKHLICK